MSPELLDWAIALGTGGVAALAGWPLTRLALHLAAGRDRARAQLPAEHEELETAAQETADDGAVAGAVTQEDLEPTPAVDDDGLLRGGLWIGLLERLIIAGGVALGDPAVVGVVVAIKGLGRVPELLKSPTAGERFMIGSLASLGVALACGAVGRALIG